MKIIKLFEDNSVDQNREGDGKQLETLTLKQYFLAKMQLDQSAIQVVIITIKSNKKI